MTDTLERRQNIRRPFEPTGDAAVDNAFHSVKADIADAKDEIIEQMNERFDAVDSDLRAIKDHLGIDDGS
jgi:hypothetical protein